jgi:insertion element IS1 protein InsB
MTQKGRGETNYLERFNNTLGQRVSRWERKTLAFSKKAINHLRAILCFTDAYLAAL